ncbi:MAG: tripartite tricarboxylate transporter substrate binding protein, partial [Betaproteobacteria bacterium]|nr:tripartite tricarboxylate transporter substrate binding protein [Betaproteobacteria bacterium]
MNRLFGILFAAYAVLMSSTAQSQTWPTKPIRMVIAFSPGGPTDLVSRVIAQRLTEQLGQNVLVDNKPG